MIYTIRDRLGEIDWAALLPGDTVRIPWRSEPYRERIVVPCRGAEGAWITVESVPGPNGELPVIDGENAVTDPQFALPYEPMESSGLVTVYPTRASGAVKPGYIRFRSLEVRNAGTGTFTNAAGTVTPWDAGANGFYLGRCDHITIEGCRIHSNGQGVMTLDSKPCADILLLNNEIWNNGVVGSDRQHNTYVQAARAAYRGNRYGPIRAGSRGGALKDRSADVLIEGNFLTAAGNVIDLGSWQDDTAERAAAPDATRSVIRNNVLFVDDRPTRLVYVEGRALPDGTGDRVGFLSNTVVARLDQSTYWYLTGFYAEYADASEIDCRGNLFDVRAKTPGAAPAEFRLFDSKGSLALGPNWSALPVSRYATGQPGKTSPKATGWENIVVGNAPPGYRDEAGGDYRLAEGAPAAGYGAGATAPPPSPGPSPDPTPDPAPEPTPYKVVSETVQTSGPFRVTVKVEVKEV